MRLLLCLAWIGGWLGPSSGSALASDAVPVLRAGNASLSFGARATGAESPGFRIWIDPKHELSAEAVAEGKLGPAQRSYALGYTSSWVWARIDLVNEAGAGDWITELSTTLVSEVEFYRFTSEKGAEQGVLKLAEKMSYRAGRSGADGSLRYRLAAFESHLKESEHSVIVLRIASLHAITLALEILPQSDFSYRVIAQHQFLGIYMGVLFAVALVNLLIFLATRERLYLDLVLHVSTFEVALTNLNGSLDFLLGEIRVGGHLIGVPSQFLSCTTMLGLFFSLQFTATFLGVRAQLPRLARAFKFMKAIAAGIFLVTLTPLYVRFRSEVGHAVALTALIDLSLILSAATFLFFHRKQLLAGWFMGAWACIGSSVVLYYAVRYELLPHTVWLDFPIETGAICQMLLLTPAVKVLIEKLTLDRAQSELRARDSERIRTLFHLTCHDLASPLSVVHLRARGELDQALEDGRESDAKAWRVIERAASQQRAILDFVRTRESVEVGKTRVNPSPVAFHEVIDNVEFLFAKRFREKDLIFRCELPELAGEVWLMADPTLLHHTVINNLVSNALKFTRPGGVITLGAERRPEEGVIRLYVRDSGIGIPAAMHPNLFLDHVPTTRSGTAGEPGNGFGLPLVLSMVRAMGGKLGFESVTEEEALKSGGKQKSGTTFWVEFAAVSASEESILKAA